MNGSFFMECFCFGQKLFFSYYSYCCIREEWELSVQGKAFQCLYCSDLEAVGKYSVADDIKIYAYSIYAEEKEWGGLLLGILIWDELCYVHVAESF